MTSNADSCEIHPEVQAACQWWRVQVSRIPGMSEDRIQTFHDTLATMLMRRFIDHWYPSEPSRGSAYRSISFDVCNGIDPLLLQAAEKAHIEDWSACFPSRVEHIVMWIDPGEVVLKVHSAGRHASEELIYHPTSKHTYFNAANNPATLLNASPNARTGQKSAALRTSQGRGGLSKGSLSPSSPAYSPSPYRLEAISVKS